MSDATRRDLVLGRLESDTQPEDEWAALALAALVDAQTALRQARSARDKARKDADQERTGPCRRPSLQAARRVRS